MAEPGSSHMRVGAGLQPTQESGTSSSPSPVPTPDSSSSSSNGKAPVVHQRDEEKEVFEMRPRRPSSLMRLGVGEAYYDGHRVHTFPDDEEEEDADDDDDDRSGLAYTAEEEQAVVAKFDKRLVLFVALLYLLSFLDRSNIGNAYIAGMDTDLQGPSATKDDDSAYEWALTAFYIAYIAFEWLSLLWTAIPAHVYVSAIVLSWGVVASCQAIVGSYSALIALRFLLGIGEAGFTGIPIYLSFFFKREELALRTAVFISAAPLATTFASSLAWVITKLGENSPIASWRLLFLLEGFPAVIVATIAFRILPDAPNQASYLTAREKQIAQQRLLLPGHHGEKDDTLFSDKEIVYDDDEDVERHTPQRGSTSSSFFHRFIAHTLPVLTDPVPWATAAIFFLTNVAYSSLPVFLPSILTQMGHTPTTAQALAAPPYLLAFLVVLIAARLSDFLQARAVLIALAAIASAAGYGFLALSRFLPGADRQVWDMWRYLAVYPAAAGFFVVVVLTIAWNVNNAARHSKGAGFALMQMIGQCGPLLGTRLYPKTDGPWFTRGMGVCAVAMVSVAVLAVGLRWYLARVNQRWDRESEQDGDEEVEGLVGGKRRKAQDRFRYML